MIFPQALSIVVKTLLGTTPAGAFGRQQRANRSLPERYELVWFDKRAAHRTAPTKEKE